MDLWSEQIFEKLGDIVGPRLDVKEQITHSNYDKYNLILGLFDAATKFASNIEPDFCKSRLLLSYPNFFSNSRKQVQQGSTMGIYVRNR
jgi:hypothetical protein